MTEATLYGPEFGSLQCVDDQGLLYGPGFGNLKCVDD